LAQRSITNWRKLRTVIYSRVWFTTLRRTWRRPVFSRPARTTYAPDDYFTINGDRRRVLFAHPDSRVRYVVTVPEKPGFAASEKPGLGEKPGFWLAFAVATAPESWEQPGDGVTFAVYVESGQDMQPETRNPKLETYVDPKQDEAARHWHPYTVDLSDYAGQTVTIIFETGAGPAGDERYDWAGWGEPRLCPEFIEGLVGR